MRHPPETDPSNGYEAAAQAFMARRRDSRAGVDAVRAWARSLPPGAAVLDLGCGCGVPISAALMSCGQTVYGVDASPTLCAAFRAAFPHVRIACEAVEASSFFGRTFDGVLAWGLLFLLSESAQLELITRMAAVLQPGGRLLFTAPARACTWPDVLTGRSCRSLGEMAYRSILQATGLVIVPGYTDQDENHYFAAARPPRTVTEGEPMARVP
jgi:2-polyprenyl-3-methyl-5-hydroxy-6-metoxy-1,4-benzoquinol methylase